MKRVPLAVDIRSRRGDYKGSKLPLSSKAANITNSGVKWQPQRSRQSYNEDEDAHRRAESDATVWFTHEQTYARQLTGLAGHRKGRRHEKDYTCEAYAMQPPEVLTHHARVRAVERRCDLGSAATAKKFVPGTHRSVIATVYPTSPDFR
jgi:hypothetical protein